MAAWGWGRGGVRWREMGYFLCEQFLFLTTIYLKAFFFLYHRYCKFTCHTVNQFNFQNLIVLVKMWVLPLKNMTIVHKSLTHNNLFLV